MLQLEQLSNSKRRKRSAAAEKIRARLKQFKANEV
jgi:hypothetical protein